MNSTPVCSFSCTTNWICLTRLKSYWLTTISTITISILWLSRSTTRTKIIPRFWRCSERSKGKMTTFTPRPSNPCSILRNISQTDFSSLWKASRLMWFWIRSHTLSLPQSYAKLSLIALTVRLSADKKLLSTSESFLISWSKGIFNWMTKQSGKSHKICAIRSSGLNNLKFTRAREPQPKETSYQWNELIY